VIKLSGEKAEKKVERWQLIAREACKQCRRNVIPELKPVLDFSALLKEIGQRPAIMLYENEEQTGLKTLLREKQESLAGREIFVLLGPEGGFSEAEVEEARRKGIIPAGLGPRILRSETAAIVVAGIIMYEYGEMEPG
jgi:16S rRNA (uracil1498-N3)-methyltransferase